MVIFYSTAEQKVTVCRKIFFFFLQNQYSYRAIELLLSHLDKHKNSEAEMRASVVEMISASVSIATGGSIGKLSWVILIPLGPSVG